MSVGRVVVVGGGVGGVATAAALRSKGYEGDIVLIDRAEFPYDRPPLSKEYLAGSRDYKDLALHPPEWYVEKRIDLWTRTAVEVLSPHDDRVGIELADGRTLDADHVVLATGGRPSLPPIRGLFEVLAAGTAHVLRDVEDADRLRAALRPGARILVIGAGLIGAEVSSCARRLGCEVVLADPLDPPLAGAVGRDVAVWLHSDHGRHEIETVATTVESVAPTEAGVSVHLSGELQLRQFDAIVIGTGMAPETRLAELAGLEVNRGVLVDRDQVTTHPLILAIGDAARPRDQRRAEHWEAAQHDGKRAAAHLLDLTAPEPAAPWWWSDRHGRHVECVGEVDEREAGTNVVLRGTLGVAPFAAFAVRARHVVGAVAVDDPKAVRAARRLIDRAVEVDPGVLADPQSDLRKLLRG